MIFQEIGDKKTFLEQISNYLPSNEFYNHKILKIYNKLCLEFYAKKCGFRFLINLNSFDSLTHSCIIRDWAQTFPGLKILSWAIKTIFHKSGLSGMYKHHITSFVQTILIIYFLQKRYNFPLLEVFNNGGNDNTQIIKYNRQLIFNFRPSEALKNNGKILLDFFDFYLNFDFKKNIIDIRSNKNQNIIRDDNLIMIIGNFGFNRPCQ